MCWKLEYEVPLSCAPRPELKSRRFGDVTICVCDAGGMNLFSESCVGIVEPGDASVSNAHAPPRLTNAPEVHGFAPVEPEQFNEYAYDGGNQLYGPSFMPDGPDSAVDLYSAEAISGMSKSASAKPWRAPCSSRTLGTLSLQLQKITLGWLRCWRPSVSAVR